MHYVNRFIAFQNKQHAPFKASLGSFFLKKKDKRVEKLSQNWFINSCILEDLNLSDQLNKFTLKLLEKKSLGSQNRLGSLVSCKKKKCYFFEEQKNLQWQ